MEKLFNDLEFETIELYKSYRLNHFSLLFMKNYYIEESKENFLTNFIIDDKSIGQIKFIGENMLEATNDNGRYQFLLASASIVSFYQIWEDKYRKKIAKNLNIEKIDSEIYYELNKLRQSILHNDHRPTNDFLKVANNLSFVNENGVLKLTVDEVHKIYLELKKEINFLKEKYSK